MIFTCMLSIINTISGRGCGLYLKFIIIKVTHPSLLIITLSNCGTSFFFLLVAAHILHILKPSHVFYVVKCSCSMLTVAFRQHTTLPFHVSGQLTDLQFCTLLQRGWQVKDNLVYFPKDEGAGSGES